MDEQGRAWREVKRGLARERRRLTSAARRRPRPLLEPVPAAESRRRAARGMRVVGAVWAAVALPVAGLVRAQVLTAAFTGLCALAAMFAGQLVVEMYVGDAERVTVDVRDGRSLLSAMTLTGTRTLDLGALVRVRRFETYGRGVRIDRLRLLDRNGVRLSLADGHDVVAALRRALEADPGVEVTGHAGAALGRSRRSRPRAWLDSFCGLWLMLASLAVPALAGYAVTTALAGTPPF